jgi:hypothetical protein
MYRSRFVPDDSHRLDSMSSNPPTAFSPAPEPSSSAEGFASSQRGNASTKPFAESQSGNALYTWLPPASVFIWLLLLVMTPICLLAGKAILTPLVESLLGLATSSEGMLPPFYFLKVAAFGILAFLGLGQLYARLQVYYIGYWSSRTPRPHPLHVDYNPEHQDSMWAYLRWQLFRLARLILPPVLGVFGTLVLGSLLLFLFNTLVVALPPLLTMIYIVMSFFLMGLAGLATVYLFGNTCWAFFGSLYGVCIVVSESDLPVSFAYDRATRIVKGTRLVYWGWGLTGLFWLSSLVASAALLWHHTLNDLWSFQLPWFTIVLVEVALAALLVLAHRVRWTAYHKALIRYYQKLPKALRDQFSPPPARETELYL